MGKLSSNCALKATQLDCRNQCNESLKMLHKKNESLKNASLIVACLDFLDVFQSANASAGRINIFSGKSPAIR